MTIRNWYKRKLNKSSTIFRFNLPAPSPLEKGWDEVKLSTILKKGQLYCKVALNSG